TVYIRVLHAVVSAPAGGSHVAGGAVTQIHWESAIVDSAQAAADTLGSAAADSIVSVALLYSVNDGASWDLIASGQPNSGSFDWMVPVITSDQAKVAVVLVQSADSTGEAVEGFLGTSETFTIQSLVGAGPPAASRTLLWAMPNPSLDGRLRVQFA